MNQEFPRFLSLPVTDRVDVFEAEAERLDTLASYVEKDFWVCWILDVLYNGLPKDRPRILFKGGTSLSKVYALIERFSEDVDFTIFAEDLGFPRDLDTATATMSKKQRERLSKDIRSKTGTYISQHLREDLEQIISNLVSNCSIAVDSECEDSSTLLFSYPSLFDRDDNDYVRSIVKLEGGGRSAVDPHQEYSIEPLIANTLPEWDFSVPNVITIDAQRTFWDKVFILHGLSCGYRDEKRLPNDRQRLSRHYYDVAKIYDSEIGKQAVMNYDLRDRVRQHKLSFFNAAWKKFDEAIPGSLCVAPTGELLEVLRKDYQAMQEMMLGRFTEFQQIIAILSELEVVVNDL
jgi:predicted nucleotidyltransferase component of viral defense system